MRRAREVRTVGIATASSRGEGASLSWRRVPSRRAWCSKPAAIRSWSSRRRGVCRPPAPGGASVTAVPAPPDSPGSCSRRSRSARILLSSSWVSLMPGPPPRPGRARRPGRRPLARGFFQDRSRGCADLRESRRRAGRGGRPVSGGWRGERAQAAGVPHFTQAGAAGGNGAAQAGHFRPRAGGAIRRTSGRLSGPRASPPRALTRNEWPRSGPTMQDTRNDAK
jgi:hypothetical protein